MVIYFTKSDYSGSSRNCVYIFRVSFSWSKENLNLSTLRLMPLSTEKEICHGQPGVHSVTTGSLLHKRIGLKRREKFM